MSRRADIVDLSAERARRDIPAPPPPVDPLFLAAEIIEQYGLDLFAHGIEAGSGTSVDDDSEEAIVLARQVRRLGERVRPAAGRDLGDAG